MQDARFLFKFIATSFIPPQQSSINSIACNFHQSIMEVLFWTFFNPPPPLSQQWTFESPTCASHRTGTVFTSQTMTMLITSASNSQHHKKAASECNSLQDHHHQSTESGGDRHCHHPREDNVPEKQAKPIIRKAMSASTHTNTYLLPKQNSSFSQRNTWGFKSSEMLGSVTGWALPSVWFMFRAKQFKWNGWLDPGDKGIMIPCTLVNLSAGILSVWEDLNSWKYRSK